MRGGLALARSAAVDASAKRSSSCTDARAARSARRDRVHVEPDRCLSQAVAFFSSFRDLTASRFWSTKMGVADLQYQGNVFVSEWNGCPDAALRKLGVL